MNWIDERERSRRRVYAEKARGLRPEVYEAAISGRPLPVDIRPGESWTAIELQMMMQTIDGEPIAV